MQANCANCLRKDHNIFKDVFLNFSGENSQKTSESQQKRYKRPNKVFRPAFGCSRTLKLVEMQNKLEMAGFTDHILG